VCNVYSSLYVGVKHQMVELSATANIRNVSSQHPLVLNFVRYYDSAGIKVRDYIEGPSQLSPLATVEFVIQREDAAGGPGANFLVQWSGSADMDEPILDAVMLGQSGSAGVSFTSAGRTVKSVTEGATGDK
jgi:hypothetical protein